VDEQAFDEGEYTRFYRWAYRSLGQIAARIDGRAYPEVKSVTQWHYDKALEPWQTTLGADYVLVVGFETRTRRRTRSSGNCSVQSRCTRGRWEWPAW
jgi:hypothetical protein